MLDNLQYGRALLVLLGAGASYDSLNVAPPHGPDRPPLTRTLATGGVLAHQLSERYNQAQPVLGELQDRMTRAGDPTGKSSIETLESVLEEYLHRRVYDGNVPRHIAALRYYLRDLLWESAQSVLGHAGGQTNYTRLVRRVYQWAARTHEYACFVSFNYDHLLETACAVHFGFDVTKPDAYTSNELVSVLKPHGSVLWAWDYPEKPNARNTDLIQRAIESGEPEKLENFNLVMRRSPVSWTFRNLQDEWRTYPALALPILGKSNLVWPPDQDELFRTRIPNGSFGNVLVIGWRAAEPHFNVLLDRLIVNGARLLVVTAGNNEEMAELAAQETYENLGRFAQRSTKRFSLNGFRGISEDDWGWILNP